MLLSKIQKDLSALGLESGDTTMVHASLRAVGRFKSGPTDLIQTILNVLGPGGTILMLIGSEDALYDIADWPLNIRELHLHSRKPFDPACTPANPEWGALGEALRTFPGAQRSKHPDYSFAAVGLLAQELVSDHSYDYCHGSHSPLEKLCQYQGKVLLLGAPFQSMTLIHHCEHYASVSGKRTIKYHAPVIQDNHGKLVHIERFDTRHNIPGFESGDYFDAMVVEYIRRGKGREGMVGKASSYLIDALDFRTFGISWLEHQLATASS